MEAGYRRLKRFRKNAVKIVGSNGTTWGRYHQRKAKEKCKIEGVERLTGS